LGVVPTDSASEQEEAYHARRCGCERDALQRWPKRRGDAQAAQHTEKHCPVAEQQLEVRFNHRNPVEGREARCTNYTGKWQQVNDSDNEQAN
jgi:hypothetical protein